MKAMSEKLTQADRRQIITDHLNGIPNELYYVITCCNGTYQVRRKKEEKREESEDTEREDTESEDTEEYEEEEEPKPIPKKKRANTKREVKREERYDSSITNDQVLSRLKEMLSSDTPQQPQYSQQQQHQRNPLSPRRRVLRL